MKKLTLPRFNKLKEFNYSNTWQTSLMVIFVVLISVSLTAWLLWKSLYLPELKSHARYLATELAILDEISNNSYGTTEEHHRLRDKMHTQYIDKVEEFPQVENKIFAGFFTDIIQEEIYQQLHRKVTVYFKFKPHSQLWIQDSKHPEYWIREPVVYYSQYNPTLFISMLLAIPFLSIISIILLTRQLNRPLRQLQKAATNYNQYGHTTSLSTQQGSIEIRQVNTAFNRLFTTLSQAQKERTIMLAGISHDLRTPLTRMRLTAEMLPDEFLREGLIYDIEDMDAILEQFISFMKDGSDEAVRLTDLNSIIHEIIVQFSPLELHYKDNQLPLIPLRPLSIKRLIINLVNNANRYGKPPIYIETRIVPTLNEFISSDISNDIGNNNVGHDITNNITNNDIIRNNNKTKQKNSRKKNGANNTSIKHNHTGIKHNRIGIKYNNESQEELTSSITSPLAYQAKEELIISIRDCGNGIEPSELARIMQPFERGETARTTQGSGLGLAIVNRIAQLHHGHVEVLNHHEGGLQVITHIPLLSKAREREPNQDKIN